jgi:hypothetical protein
MEHHIKGENYKNGKGYKAKDTPWDAVPMGSVACSIAAKRM